MNEAIAQVAPSLATVSVQSKQGWVRSGSAFATATRGVFATCAHVIHDQLPLSIECNGAHRIATLALVDLKADVALLRTDLDVAGLTLGTISEVNPGDELLWGGFPSGSWLLSWHKGMVSYVGELPTGSIGIQLDGTVNRGNSGGPIVDPRTFRVIGVVSSSLSDDMVKLRQALQVLGRSQGRASIVVGSSAGSINIIDTLVEAVQLLERTMQLGVGYGVSADYVSKLLVAETAG